MWAVPSKHGLDKIELKLVKFSSYYSIILSNFCIIFLKYFTSGQNRIQMQNTNWNHEEKWDLNSTKSHNLMLMLIKNFDFN